MNQIRLLAGIGLAALLASLVGLIPANVALAMLGVPADTVSGVSGTVWHGSLQRLSLDNMTLGPVSWQARPARLLLGQLAADVEATLPDGFVNTRAAISLGGSLSFSDLEGAAPVAWLAPAAGRDGGQLSARFEQVIIDGERIKSAVGSLQIAGVVLPIPTAGARLAPGNYAITFDAEDLAPDALLSGAVTDGGGPLEIAGTLTFTPPRSYELSGTAKPRPEAPPELRTALQMLGPADAAGAHAVKLAGSF
jgi:general secretion pathway protein N